MYARLLKQVSTFIIAFASMHDDKIYVHDKTAFFNLFGLNESNKDRLRIEHERNIGVGFID
jgi:hypothetical protein